jgi:hypothetical protein
MAADLCPWLGTFDDRQTQYAEATEAHACYAQKRPADVALAHQGWYCLTDQHRACRFFREPPTPPVRRERDEPALIEDEVGPPPARFPLFRVVLWVMALAVTVAVVYYYGSALLAPMAGPTPAANSGDRPSPTASATPTFTLLPVAAPASAVLDPREPATTPTPYPGGAIYSLAPQAGGAGWVASDESRGNHLGDSYLYAGVFDGVIYHGIFQFDLRAVPRGATIHSAVLEITGLDGRRLGSSGAWEVRILAREGDAGWSRSTFQSVHNGAVQWTLTPALAAGDLNAGKTNVFGLSAEQIRDLEQRLLDQHYTVSFRLDGPLAGESSTFAWDSGFGPASQGHGPRLLLNVGPPPKTLIPTGSLPPTSTPIPSPTPTATDTPVWFVVTSTPTPGNAVTAAAVALRETAWATTTGTPTPLPEFVATATPRFIVVTNTPTPASYATAVYLRALATANAILTGTPTPTPPFLATATYTPRPTRTPVYVWLDQLAGTPTPVASPTPTTPPIPAVLKGQILFLSDRGGQVGAFMLDPSSGRTALLTARWPYDVALQNENLSPDGQARAYVQNDGKGVPQVYVYSKYYGGSWQVTYNTGTSYDPVWSPGGDRLAFVSTEGGNDDIYVIDTDGRNQQRLTFNQWEWDKHPSWSPDGRQIVFWSNEGTGRRQLWIMTADGGERRILLDSPYNDWDPVWVK